jgi:hypothetical protein
MAEIDRMMDADMVEQARMVFVYYGACEAKQSVRRPGPALRK